MKKIFSFLLASAVMASLTACSGAAKDPASNSGTTAAKTEETSKGASGKGEKVEISFLVTKPEIVPQFEETFKKYSESNPNVTISAIPLSGQTIYEKLTSLYASGNAPTITMVGGPEFNSFKDNFLDLSNADFAKKVYSWAIDKTTVDNKVLAVPTTAEGIGIMYNKTVIEAATGRDFDPASIKNRQDFAKLLEEISKTEYAPVQITNKDWLLGSHLTSVLYGSVSKDFNERQAVIEACKKGEYDFSNSEVFNNWMDTFDLLMKYNKYQKAPLANAYEDDQLTMGSDQVAFWPIGNYIYPNIIDINPIADVGLMPYPMGDDDAAVGNKDIVLSYSMFAIDAKQSTPAQQEAAIDFFNWLITTDEGQDAYINTLIFVPIFEGFKVQPSNPVAKQIVAYMEKGDTLERMSDYFPAGVMNQFGATMQQYLDGKIQRADVAEQFKKQWVEFSSK
ncbi:ABC transporter substrate-binding protein [Lacrimispora aerotolerans]|uniref:ABC transporter substrate-binding protein n=1 Tax=Lacrimispora aerotolerans TaxID=36832 RepID=UPI00068C0F41|nr:ABC transporter substrate-binding protein [Lacrimispora aerotolerans]